MDIYRETILDHYKNPRNAGTLRSPSVTATLANSVCGDSITMDVRFGEKNSIREIRFSGAGCAISIASASMLTELVLGKKAEDVMNMGLQDILDLLGTSLTPSRTKCALLPLETLQKAIHSCINKSYGR